MGPQSADEAEVRGAPLRAGRYVLGRVLGAGGMGVVRASHDPALDRAIAVKLIGGVELGPASDEADGDDTQGQLVPRPGSPPRPTSAAVDDAQLLAEARALARVAHPNIVEVFDVGVCEAGVFIAMELVDGVPLRAWNETRRPDWRTAVELHLHAGEALAAAHRVGIVHGDFKPDNVLVGRDDRVKVVDFGLARAIGRLESMPTDTDPERTAARASAVFGTPAYLAPECWSVAERNPAADQFAFFVALFEAIAGRRPYRRVGSLGALLMQMTEGADGRPLHGRVPDRLARAIVRGLDPDPTRRFATMSAALVELRAILAEDGRRRARRRLVGIASIVVVPVLLATVGVGAWSAWRTHAAIRACHADAGTITAAWNDEARARIEAAFVAADPRTGAGTFARVVPWLDAYAAAWSDLRGTSCARAVEDSTAASAIDLGRDRCFAERKAALAGLVEVLALADDRVVRDAVRSAADLPRVAACDDEAWLALQSGLPEDASTRAQVAELQGELARADQLAAGGQAEAALELADAAVTSATQLAWPAVLARAHWTRGHALAELGRYPDAERELEQAYFHAGEAADDATRAATAAELALLVGTKLARFADGLVWARHAETALAALGGTESETDAKLAIATAAILARSGAIEQSLAPAERALAIRTRVFGPDHPSVGAAESTVGSTLARLDRMSDAVVHFERAREVLERALGPDHPDVASVVHNLGMAEVQFEHYDAARRLHARSLAIREAVLPADHPDVATSLAGLAYADLGLHRFAEARQGFARVLAIREARLGPDHPAVADTLANLAQVAEKLGDCREAVRTLDRALTIVQSASAADHRTRLRFGLNLADALLECHDRPRALLQYEVARELAAADPRAFARELERASSGIAATRVTAG